MPHPTARPLACILLGVLALLTPALASAADLVLPSVISDGMVLQRDAAVPLWGKATPGQTVTVVLDNRVQEVATTADKDGRWKLELSPMPAGGPHTLVVHAGGQARVVKNILVGEVWLASGQSNMQWPVVRSAHAPREIAAADLPQIRIFRTKLTLADEPGFTLAGNDRVFHVADAEILDDGRTVRVRSDAVEKPVAVRYAWQNNPVDANLVNSAQLPASSFRTDRWPHPTDDER